jgi:hypothetical protein
MSEVTFVTSRVITLDDVRYAFSIYKSVAGFTGFWECEHCPNPGLRTNAAKDLYTATKDCDRAIHKHHAKNHPVAVEALAPCPT